jgi:hypothetical protein
MHKCERGQPGRKGASTRASCRRRPPSSGISKRVAEKMKDRARRTLERSAEQAGFMEQGRNRLVRPGVAVRDELPVAEREEPPRDEPPAKNGGRGTGGFGEHDALIVGLFRKLPRPETDWPDTDRMKWLQTAANIFDLVYKGDGGGFNISPARAERSPRPRDPD